MLIILEQGNRLMSSLRRLPIPRVVDNNGNRVAFPDIRRVLTENSIRDLIDNMDEQSIRTYLADRQNADPT